MQNCHHGYAVQDNMARGQDQQAAAGKEVGLRNQDISTCIQVPDQPRGRYHISGCEGVERETVLLELLEASLRGYLVEAQLARPRRICVEPGVAQLGLTWAPVGTTGRLAMDLASEPGLLDQSLAQAFVEVSKDGCRIPVGLERDVQAGSGIRWWHHMVERAERDTDLLR